MKNEKIRKTLNTINNVTEIKIGLLLLSILVLISVCAPFIATHDPYFLNDSLMNPPSKEYLLGTDGLGRDVFSMIIYGSQTSLKVGIIAASISGIIGTIVGAISGYYGGIIDKIVSEIINMFLMMPTFFLILMVVAFFGSSMTNVIIVIGLTSWTGTARLMRAQAISLRERTFVKSAITIGEKKSTILFKHIIPNGIFPVIANTTMTISSAILSEAGLSFLGLGDPNVISWGQMISQGKGYLPGAWWICTFAGLAIVFTVLTFFLIGEGMNKVLSPKLNRQTN